MNKLTINRDSFVLGEINLEAGTMTIGRAEDNDIHLDDSATSGHHAKIVSIFTATHIEDVGSTNGTFVNGHRIEEHTLHSGDIISIGGHQLLFQSGRQGTTQPEKTMIMSGDKLGDMVELAKRNKQMEARQAQPENPPGEKRGAVSFVEDLAPTEIDMDNAASGDQGRARKSSLNRGGLLKNIELEQQSVNEIRSRLVGRKNSSQGSRYITLLAIIGAVIVIVMLVLLMRM
ncbi:MAG TPA: FHA domain-containing protein [Gammaproteobacteria bacterium]|nr:FHA domain-containing protein [Gammaproteobacteria bacterium]